MQKHCTKCKKSKNLSEFSKCARNKDGLQYRCKDCDSRVDRSWYMVNKAKKRKDSKAWYLANKDKIRSNALKQYGLSLEQYKAMLLAQNGNCAICNKKERGKALAVDHCHKTNKVRGLLCQKCNRAVGLLNDDPNLCASASSYLKAYCS